MRQHHKCLSHAVVVVGNHQFSECNPVLCCVWEGLPFLIVDLTLHGQWHICQSRRRPPSSGKFACLESHLSLATCNRATVDPPSLERVWFVR